MRLFMWRRDVSCGGGGGGGRSREKIGIRVVLLCSVGGGDVSSKGCVRRVVSQLSP